MSRLVRARALGLAIAATASLPGVARADLREVSARVADQWRAAGGAVSVGKTRFLNEDETLALPVMAGEGECVNVVLVGATGNATKVGASRLATKINMTSVQWISIAPTKAPSTESNGAQPQTNLTGISSGIPTAFAYKKIHGNHDFN